MATAEQTYSYLAPSQVTLDAGTSEVTLATSGGRAPHPYFLARPRQSGQALLVVAEVARSRYYEPAQMIAARILAADPVVTSNLPTWKASHMRRRPARGCTCTRS